MPGFDGTGPRGMGPMTGGGRGMCVVNLSAGMDPVVGQVGHTSWPVCQPLTRHAELAQLRGQARYLEGVLAGIRGRIECLRATQPQAQEGA